MKLNRFTQKALVKEFPFLQSFIEGQEGRWDYTCKCGEVYSVIHQISHDWVGIQKCPACQKEDYLSVTSKKEIHPHIHPHSKIEEVLIKKVDENFLRSIPESYSWDGSVVNIDRGSTIRFVTRQDHPVSSGPIFGISESVQCSGTSGSNYAHSETSKWDGESVAHAIDRLGLRPEQLVAVLEYQYGIRTIEHYSEGARLIVWKAGKVDQTIKAVIDRFYSEAAEQAAAEADL